MSYRSTTAFRMLMCETSVNIPRFLSMYSRRSSRLWFALFSSVLEILKVTKRLANSSVRTVMGIRIITSRLSTTRNLTCKRTPVWCPEDCSYEMFSLQRRWCSLAANVSSQMRLLVTRSI